MALNLEDFAAIAFGAVVVVWVTVSVARQWMAQPENFIFQQGTEALRQWLEDGGFVVCGERPSGQWTGYYDTAEFTQELGADFIVRRGAKYYAVTSGTPDTTRVTAEALQKSTYPLYVTLGVDGVLEVERPGGNVHMVDFEIRQPAFVWRRRALNRSLWFVSGMLFALMWIHG